jgi:tRNA(Ile2) C34 agmatinyltransferase TiaS
MIGECAKQCPRCKTWMKWYFSLLSGGWRCISCGYDTADVKVTVSWNTAMKEANYDE